MRTKSFPLILSFILLSFSYTFAQQGWGAGLRLGDPTGLTAKYYAPKYAVEFNLGPSYYIGGYNYPNNFYSRYPKDKNYVYLGYNNGSSLDLQIHFLKSK